MRTVTTTASTFDMDKEFNDERFCRVRIAVMHSGMNRNKSYFSKETIENAKETFKNIPILADVQRLYDDEGNEYYDYTGHTMHIEKDAFSDNDRIIYDERVVGVIPEQNDFELTYIEDRDVYMAYVTGLLYRAYGNYVCDILEERDGKTEVSAEILCNDMEYDANKDCLNVTDMTMHGVTLLGEHIMAGMEGANAQTFSADENNINEQMLVFMKEIKESLDKYINLAKGGKPMFEQLLEKYGKTVEDIDFEYEGLTDEELEAAFANAFAEDDKVDDEVEDEVDDKNEPDEDEANDEDEDEADDEVKDEIEDEEETFETNFPLANLDLNERVRALYELVANTYDAWYDVVVYDDYVVMHNWGASTGYKQSYTEENGVFSLVGEQIPVASQWLTAEEQRAVANLKNKVEQYEAEPQKMEILESADYSSIQETDEYKSLLEDHFNYSVDEVRVKADEILLNYAKTAQTFDKSVSSKTLPTLRKKGRYGNLFN